MSKLIHLGGKIAFNWLKLEDWRKLKVIQNALCKITSWRISESMAVQSMNT